MIWGTPTMTLAVIALIAASMIALPILDRLSPAVLNRVASTIIQMCVLLTILVVIIVSAGGRAMDRECIRVGSMPIAGRC